MEMQIKSATDKIFWIMQLSEENKRIEFPGALRHCFRMNVSEQSSESPVCNISEVRKAVEPCTIVIFGASGDLTARKLIPALYHLAKDKQLPPAYRIIGFARRD